MKKRNRKYFFNLLKSMRIYRVFPTLMVILVAASFADLISKDIIILGFVGILIYSSYGIHNALRDKDYFLPKYSKKVILVLLFIVFVTSILNRVIFLTAVIAISLGFIYNTFFRYLVLGDTTILTITHYVLPFFSSSVLLGLDLDFAIKFSGALFFVFWFLLPIKNLKGIQEDRKRKYRTLTTVFKNGKLITFIFFWISFVLMIGSYFLFELKHSYLFVLLFIFILSVIISLGIFSDKKETLWIARGITLIFLFGIIISSTKYLLIIWSGLGIIVLYLSVLIFKIQKKNGKRISRI